MRKKLILLAVLAATFAGSAGAAASQWLSARSGDRVRVPGGVICVVTTNGLGCANGSGRLGVALVTGGGTAVAVITKDGHVVAKRSLGG